MINSQMVGAIESILNHHISESSASKNRLRSLAEKTLLLDIKEIDIKFCLKSEGTYLSVYKVDQSDKQKITAAITGTPLTFLRLLRSSTVNDLIASGVIIDGDIAIIEGFSEMLRFARPELEEELSHIVGDVAANEISKAVRDLTNWGSYALKKISTNTSEYLQQESNQLPSRFDVETFNAEVDILREDLDRAEKRIDQLKSKKVVRQHGST